MNNIKWWKEYLKADTLKQIKMIETVPWFNKLFDDVPTDLKAQHLVYVLEDMRMMLMESD